MSTRAIAKAVVKIAHGQIGYVEKGGADSRSGNITKYWRRTDPSLQGQSWCADFVSWCFERAGHELPAIDRPYGYVNCASAVNWARRNGTWSASGHYAKGDIIFYCWDGSGVAEHTGIVVEDNGAKGIRTIEGNTSPTDAGSQSNGGGVYPKIRYHGSTVLGVISLAKLAKLEGWAASKPKAKKPTKAEAKAAVAAWFRRWWHRAAKGRAF